MTRLVVTGGGQPDPGELAALVVALTTAAPAPVPTDPPAWLQAALIEGVGEATVLSPPDLDVLGRRV